MRPFRITPEKLQELVNKYQEHLKSINLASNSFSFTEHFTDVKDKNKVFLTFTMKAYVKMRDLVDRYNSEIGWYGFIDKISDLEYRVTDICVYPQLVTGSTVKETNEPWDDDMPIEQIKRRHFHGHSHVNMGVSPSPTDIKHRSDQAELVNSNSFYVFMITNKRCEWSAAVFDLAANIIYSTEDILIDVDLGEGEMLSDFISNTQKMVKTSTAAAVKTMMDERNGATTAVTTPQFNATASSPWLPKPKQGGKTGKKTAAPAYEQLSLRDRIKLVDITDEALEELEDMAYSQQGYYDDILGQVSDSPAECNRAVLEMMR